MTLFRPCIDLHEGGEADRRRSLDTGHLETNFVSPHGAAHFAALYRDDELIGGHLIMLGPGNETEAAAALAAYPGGLQLGGGVTPKNAERWLERGASKVIATSALFEGAELSMTRVREMSQVVGRDRLVIDLSCRRVGEGYRVAAIGGKRSPTPDRSPCPRLARRLRERVLGTRGRRRGSARGRRGSRQDARRNLIHSVTYAGGAKQIEDLERVDALSPAGSDLTIGSALDIFGGRRFATPNAWRSTSLEKARSALGWVRSAPRCFSAPLARGPERLLGR